MTRSAEDLATSPRSCSKPKPERISGRTSLTARLRTFPICKIRSLIDRANRANEVAVAIERPLLIFT
jgi:hypothetical protein